MSGLPEGKTEADLATYLEGAETRVRCSTAPLIWDYLPNPEVLTDQFKVEPERTAGFDRRCFTAKQLQKLETLLGGEPFIKTAHDAHDIVLPFFSIELELEPLPGEPNSAESSVAAGKAASDRSCHDGMIAVDVYARLFRALGTLARHDKKPLAYTLTLTKRKTIMRSHYYLLKQDGSLGFAYREDADHELPPGDAEALANSLVKTKLFLWRIFGPWSRQLLGKLLEELDDHGPKKADKGTSCD